MPKSALVAAFPPGHKHKSTVHPRSRRRPQVGTERTTTPLPVIHPRPSARRLALSRLAIIATVVAWLAYIITTLLRRFIDETNDFRFTMEAAGYLVVVTMLTFSALMYLLARHHSLLQFGKHHRASRAELAQHFEANQDAAITVLVPSYAEEPQVVRQTLWSAALQEYPDVNVVLLLDDPPDAPGTNERLDATRALPMGIEEALREPGTRLRNALESFEASLADEPSVTEQHVLDLAGHYAWAADWLTTMSEAESVTDHVDVFFTGQVLDGLAADLDATSTALRLAVADELPGTDRMLQLHRRLAWIFTARLRAFERKQYANLSHEANKAMNLNSYLGLIGGNYVVDVKPRGQVLRPAAMGEQPDLVVPASEFVLTLDADSLLLPEYCLRLVHVMQQPGNERIAVTQTPYSSYRGAGTRIERLAGATTDIQHLLHQGMGHADATFWVGANAVIRTAALRDIAESAWEGDVHVTRFVQDRTVIEDTESSIDLGVHGWKLLNYAERLSYSATPPDFGSLVVQRRRWANGGLLILPKYWRQLRLRRRAGEQIRMSEVLLRVNYMASIAWASVGLVFLLAYPYDSRLLSPLIIATALPYFLTMGADLRQCGYKFTDIFRIYGFNLILLPVNLAGVLKSLQQALTGEKIPFARTPKVKNRTAAPWLYALAPVLIVAFSVLTCWRDVEQQNWGNAAFAAFNALCGTWAFVAYVGVWNAVVDITLGLRAWFYVERKTPKASPAGDVATAGAVVDWRLVLEEGTLTARADGGTRREAPLSVPALAAQTMMGRAA